MSAGTDVATDHGPWMVGAVNQTAFWSANHAPLGAWIRGTAEFATYFSSVPSIGRVSGVFGKTSTIVAVARSTSAVCGICVAMIASFDCIVPGSDAFTFSLGLPSGISPKAGGRSLAATWAQGPFNPGATNQRPLTSTYTRWVFMSR